MQLDGFHHFMAKYNFIKIKKLFPKMEFHQKRNGFQSLSNVMKD